jgi:hypothetical protein
MRTASIAYQARARLVPADCCAKNTAKDFANKMQNPGHLSLGAGKPLLV